METNHKNRRQFIKQAGLAALLPGSLAAAAPTTGASRPATKSNAPLAATNRVFPDIDRIIKAGVLRTGFIEKDNQPFFSMDGDGEIKGIDVDLAKGIASALNVEIVIDRNSKSFGELFDRVANGHLDLAFCKLSRTVARSMRVHLSNPYVEFYHAAAFNRERLADYGKGADIEKTIKTFSGTMGVLKGTTWGVRAKAVFPKSSIVEYPDWDSLVAATKTGSVMACYRDEFEVKKLFKTNPELTISLRGVILTDSLDTISGVIAPDLVNLKSVVNTYLDLENRKYNTKSLLSLL